MGVAWLDVGLGHIREVRLQGRGEAGRVLPLTVRQPVGNRIVSGDARGGKGGA